MVGNKQIRNTPKHIKGSSLPFGGVGIIAVGDLFQIQPVMDRYFFKDMANSEYDILSSHLWKEFFPCLNYSGCIRNYETKGK